MAIVSNKAPLPGIALLGTHLGNTSASSTPAQIANERSIQAAMQPNLLSAVGTHCMEDIRVARHGQAAAFGPAPRYTGLTCVGCRQAKVKCDKTEPCSRCTRIGMQCVQQLRKRSRRPSASSLASRKALTQHGPSPFSKQENTERTNPTSWVPRIPALSPALAPISQGRGQEFTHALGQVQAQAQLEVPTYPMLVHHPAATAFAQPALPMMRAHPDQSMLFGANMAQGFSQGQVHTPFQGVQSADTATSFLEVLGRTAHSLAVSRNQPGRRRGTHSAQMPDTRSKQLVRFFSASFEAMLDWRSLAEIVQIADELHCRDALHLAQQTSKLKLQAAIQALAEEQADRAAGKPPAPSTRSRDAYPQQYTLVPFPEKTTQAGRPSQEPSRSDKGDKVVERDSHAHQVGLFAFLDDGWRQQGDVLCIKHISHGSSISFALSPSCERTMFSIHTLATAWEVKRNVFDALAQYICPGDRRDFLNMISSIILAPQSAGAAAGRVVVCLMSKLGNVPVLLEAKVAFHVEDERDGDPGDRHRWQETGTSEATRQTTSQGIGGAAMFCAFYLTPMPNSKYLSPIMGPSVGTAPGTQAPLGTPASRPATNRTAATTVATRAGATLVADEERREASRSDSRDRCSTAKAPRVGAESNRSMPPEVAMTGMGLPPTTSASGAHTGSNAVHDLPLSVDDVLHAQDDLSFMDLNGGLLTDAFDDLLNTKLESQLQSGPSGL